MSKSVIGFIVFMVVGVTSLLLVKLVREELDESLKGKEYILTGTCEPAPKVHMNIQVQYYVMNKTPIEILKAESLDKFRAIITGTEKIKVGSDELNLTGTEIKCDQKKYPFNIKTLGK